ncbi:MAG: TetR/AcrR family transcriptional regulator [Roseinatronobacter sp.]
MSDTPRPSRRNRKDMIAQTTARLVAEARRAFAMRGYAEVSAAELCAAAGFTRGALYHHFGGKEGLLEAVLAQIDSEVGARLDAAAHAHSDPWAAFRACCLSYLDLALEPEIQRIVLRDAPAVLGQRFRDLDAAASLEPMIDAVRGLMDAGYIRSGDVEVLARLLNGAVLEAALWVAAGEEPARRLPRARATVELLLDGLRAPGSCPSALAAD